jgi:hypothetical protein
MENIRLIYIRKKFQGKEGSYDKEFKSRHKK